MNSTTTLPACGLRYNCNSSPRMFAGFLRSLRALPLLAALCLAPLSGAVLAQDAAIRVNLNTADAETLQYIPGIGPGKSAEIIRVREESGGFKVMDDLLAVPGVGAKLLVNLVKYGVLRGGVSTLPEEMRDSPSHRKTAAGG